MTDEDAIFEDIRALSDRADDAGLIDVAFVLEFAMDVFLKETGLVDETATSDVMRKSDGSAEALKVRPHAVSDTVPRAGWKTSSFQKADIACKAS